MKVVGALYKGRKSWELDNGTLSLVMHQGGGNLAALRLNADPAVNPLWEPVWQTIEPWQYRPERDQKRFGVSLLASISGHNLCLGWFGDPSPAEARAGLPCHGEAPVSRWKLKRKAVGKETVSFTTVCELPVAGMHFERTVSSRRGSHVVAIREVLTNRERRDIPFTMCQHVTLGPPFLEKGVTLFDMPALQGHTFPGAFGQPQRLKADTAFTWPAGPGVDGEPVDLRLYAKRFRKSSDFSTQLVEAGRELAWFSAINPRLGMMIAYVWERADYPWIGNWEENYGRKAAPWGGNSLTRGMEFANTPFPVGLRRAVDMGTFQGEPTFRWLPAKERLVFNYSIILSPVQRGASGVADIRRAEAGFAVDLAL